MKYAYTFTISGEEGDYIAQCDQMPHALTGAKTIAELENQIPDALRVALRHPAKPIRI